MMAKTITPLALAVMAAISLAHAETPAKTDEVRDIAGKRTVGNVLTLDEAVGVEGGAKLPVNELWEIIRPVPAAAPLGVQVFLASGLLQANNVTVAKGQATVSRPGVEPMVLPTERLLAIRYGANLTPPGIAEAWTEALATAPTAKEDRLLAVDEKGRLQVVPGSLVSVDDKELLFVYREKERKLVRASVYACVFAGGGNAASAPGASGVEVALADSSQLRLSEPRLADGKFSGKLPGGASLTFAWPLVQRIEFRSPRLVFLSELTPAGVDEKRLLAPELPWRRDQNTLHQPLTLAGQTYRRGIGVHADSRLRFDLARGYKRFATTVGLDPVGRDGDCICRVELDGREVFRQRLRTADKPVDIALDVADIQQLELIVESGENLDLGDYVNWAEARLLR